MSFISRVPEIDHLFVDQVPTGKVTKMTKAIRVDKVVVMVGENGRLYSTHGTKFAYMPGKWPWLIPFMKAMVKLKVITKQQCDDHIQYCNDVDERRTKKWASERILENCETLGIKLNKQQMSKLLAK
jgi:hypothetical protein